MRLSIVLIRGFAALATVFNSFLWYFLGLPMF